MTADASNRATTKQPRATAVPVVDWGEIRAAFGKGVPLAEISRRTGINPNTIRARSARGKWSAAIAKAEEFVQQHATDALAVSASRWITRIDSLVHQSLENLEKKGIQKLSIRDLQTALDCAERANRVARLNFGLDSENNARPKLTVNLNVLAGQSTSASWGKAQDVESTLICDAPSKG